MCVCANVTDYVRLVDCCSVIQCTLHTHRMRINSLAFSFFLAPTRNALRPLIYILLKLNRVHYECCTDLQSHEPVSFDFSFGIDESTYLIAFVGASLHLSDSCGATRIVALCERSNRRVADFIRPPHQIQFPLCPHSYSDTHGERSHTQRQGTHLLARSKRT